MPATLETPLALDIHQDDKVKKVAAEVALEGFTGPGSLAAAYHLLVVVRPSWFAAHGRTVPPVPAEAIGSLNERLIATHAP